MPRNGKTDLGNFHQDLKLWMVEINHMPFAHCIGYLFNDSISFQGGVVSNRSADRKLQTSKSDHDPDARYLHRLMPLSRPIIRAARECGPAHLLWLLRFVMEVRTEHCFCHFVQPFFGGLCGFGNRRQPLGISGSPQARITPRIVADAADEARSLHGRLRLKEEDFENRVRRRVSAMQRFGHAHHTSYPF